MSSSNFLGRLFRPFTSGAARFHPESAAEVVPEGAQQCIVAAGCFWGTEHVYRKQFGGKGLYRARVGYIGGDNTKNTYQQVCSGRTNHAEGLLVEYDPARITYRQLIEFLFIMHDPTTKNRQGPDVGSQYRSAIFYLNDEQKQIAEKVKDQVQKQWWKDGEVKTTIEPADLQTDWHDAETYHQKYLEDNPGGYECPTHFLRKFPPLQD